MATRDRFRKALAVALAPLGIKEEGIEVTPKGISVPEAGLAVTAELSSKGRRVWRAVSRFTIPSAAGEGLERTVTTVLFEEPFEREWAVARRIAMTIAEWRIDAAIDDACG